MTYYTRIALPLLCLGLIACTGSIDQQGTVDRGSIVPGKITYQGLMRQAQYNHVGEYIVDNNDFVGADSFTIDKADIVQASFTSVTVKQKLEITTVSTNHAGDLDFVIEAMILEDYDLISTLELPNGTVIGKVNLTDLGVVTPEQLKHPSVTNSIDSLIDVKVTSDLVKQGIEFPVNLFTCLDSNGNGKCSDELVDVMDNVPENLNDKKDLTFNVIYFAPLTGIVTMSGETANLDLQRDTTVKEDTPNDVMRDILKNLTPQNGSGPFSLNLAIGTEPTGGVANQAPEGAPLSVKELAELREAEQKAQAQKEDVAQNPTVNGPPPIVQPIIVQPRQKKRTNGCFIAGTRIFIGNGRSVLVETLGIGSDVVNLASKKLTIANAVVGPEKHPIIQIRTAGGHQLGVTRTHPMWTPSGLKLAKDLKKGDLLVTAKGNPVAITSLNRVPYQGQVHNLALPGSGSTKGHLIIAEGLVTGDLYLQQKLSSQK